MNIFSKIKIPVILSCVALLGLPACESLTNFSEMGHGGTSSQSSKSYNYTPSVVYPDAQGSELGFQALGRDLSDGSVTIYSLQGSQNAMPIPLTEQTDRFAKSESIPVADNSVTVYDLSAVPAPANTRQEIQGVALSPPTMRELPSPFVKTRNDGPLIAATPMPRASQSMVNDAPLTGPRMTAP